MGSDRSEKANDRSEEEWQTMLEDQRRLTVLVSIRGDENDRLRKEAVRLKRDCSESFQKHKDLECSYSLANARMSAMDDQIKKSLEQKTAEIKEKHDRCCELEHVLLVAARDKANVARIQEEAAAKLQVLKKKLLVRTHNCEGEHGATCADKWAAICANKWAAICATCGCRKSKKMKNLCCSGGAPGGGKIENSPGAWS